MYTAKVNDQSHLWIYHRIDFRAPIFYHTVQCITCDKTLNVSSKLETNINCYNCLKIELFGGKSKSKRQKKVHEVHKSNHIEIKEERLEENKKLNQETDPLSMNVSSVHKGVKHH